MKEFMYFNSYFWQDPMMRALSMEGKVLAIYLLTGPHRYEDLKSYHVSIQDLLETLKWPVVQLIKAIEELNQRGFINSVPGHEDLFTIQSLVRHHHQLPRN
jgi:hypothetical protein